MSPRLRIPKFGDLGLARATVALAVSLLALPLAVQAQPRPTRPDLPRHYAITGARIVTGSGQTINDGTVVMDDGLITAVGRNVPVPAGAWVIDGSGKTVYPGFIDALTDLGHPAARAARPAAGGGSPFGPQGPIDEANYSWGPEDRPGTHSWVSAAEGINEGDARFAQWRNAGFTTVVSALDDGLVTGQAAVLNLGEYERGRGMVVATPVAMRLKLQDRSYQGYPQSLMGSFAYLKQLYLDAQYYDRVWDDYEADPRGKQRPTWDEALEPLRWQFAEDYPVLFPADNRKEIERAIVTSGVMGVSPVVYGAQAAYAAADLLAGAGVPALVSLNWPTAPRDGDPEAEPALETLRLWDRAPTTPAELQRAGVAFAFTSGGLSDPSQILANARKAVAQGLSKDAAIQAFTMSPARIMGVEDRLGSIEVGKIANLVVASGDLLEAGTKVETVFVDGDKFEVPQDEAPARGRRAQADEDAGQPPVAMAQDKGPFRRDAVTLIRNATIMTASHGTIVGGDILVRDGKIAQVGTGIQAPRGAHVVDGTGKYVTPGIIDAHSHIAADAINEGAVNVSSMVGIKDVLEPNDPNLYWALAGGVTSINILHGSANPIGGGNAVLKLKWGSDAQEMIVPGSHEGIKFALGENTKRDRNPPRYPATRMGVQDVVRQAFLDAQGYQRGWDAWEAGEILQLIRLADEFHFTVRTFQHVLEGYKVADEMAAHGAGASTFSDWWAYKVEAYDAIPYNAALMEERGVLVSINSDSGEEMRHLNQEAAKAMKWGGMEEERALRLVTLNPAMQLGIDDRTGSIDVGKDADLTIFDGPPLSMFAKVLQTYVEGMLYFDRDLDRERQAAVEAEKAALLERYGSNQGSETVTSDRVAPGHGEEVVR